MKIDDAHDDSLWAPMYDVPLAARIIGMSPSTLRAWCCGARGFAAVLDLPKSPDAKKRYLSYINLTEAFVLSALRKRYEIRMPNVRTAMQYMAKEMRIEHPLAFEDFATDRVDLFVRTADGHVNASKYGQTALPELQRELARVEWRNKRPIALFPLLGVHRPERLGRRIRVSPHVAFGRPTIDGTGITTSAIADRFLGGETIEELAEDYALAATDVEDAVRAQARFAA